MSDKNIYKCPGCGYLLHPLSNFCEMCNFTIADSNEKNKYNINELIYKLESNLAEIKSLPSQNISNTLYLNLHLVSIFFGLLLCLNSFFLKINKWNDDYWGPILILGFIFTLIGMFKYIYDFFKVRNINHDNDLKNNNKIKKSRFIEIKADFEKNIGFAEIYYSKDLIVKNIINELNLEIKKAENRNKKNNIILYSVLILFLFSPLLLPKSKKIKQQELNEQISKTLFNSIFVKNNIKLNGNIGDKLTISSSSTKLNYDGNKFTIPLKFNIKINERDSLKKIVFDIIKNCDYSFNNSKSILKNCSKINCTLLIINNNDNSSGVEFHLSYESENNLYDLLETNSNEFFLNFSIPKLNEDQADLIKSSKGAFVSITLVRKINL